MYHIFIIYIIIYSLPFIVSDLALLQDCPYMANQADLVNLVDLVTLAYLINLAELADLVTKYYILLTYPITSKSDRETDN